MYVGMFIRMYICVYWSYLFCCRQFSHISRYYEITFRTTEKNGMLLLLQNNSTVEMDYLIIVINKGRMKASFKLGNESSKKFIDSKKYVADDQWHTVQFSR